jgi:hypothetical protein
MTWSRAPVDHKPGCIYYPESGDEGAPLGFIELNGKIKLGGVALAALALLEHRDDASPRFLHVRRVLDRTVMRLFNAGEVRLISHLLPPAGPQPQPRVLPGVSACGATRAVVVTAATWRPQHLLRAARHHRRWHLSERNPAFVPWHTQACYLRYMQL